MAWTVEVTAVHRSRPNYISPAGRILTEYRTARVATLDEAIRFAESHYQRISRRRPGVTLSARYTGDAGRVIQTDHP